MKKDGFGVEYDIADLDENPDQAIDDLIGKENLREDPERGERVVPERGDSGDADDADGDESGDAHEPHLDAGEKLEPLDDSASASRDDLPTDQEQLNQRGV